MGKVPMRTQLGILFLGMMVGGTTFLVIGLASYLTIAQLQYRTLEARTTQVVVAANQFSTRAKSPSSLVMADGDVTVVRYGQISP